MRWSRKDALAGMKKRVIHHTDSELLPLDKLVDAINVHAYETLMTTFKFTSSDRVIPHGIGGKKWTEGSKYIRQTSLKCMWTGCTCRIQIVTTVNRHDTFSILDKKRLWMEKKSSTTQRKNSFHTHSSVREEGNEALMSRIYNTTKDRVEISERRALAAEMQAALERDAEAAEREGAVEREEIFPEEVQDDPECLDEVCNIPEPDDIPDISCDSVHELHRQLNIWAKERQTGFHLHTTKHGVSSFVCCRQGCTFAMGVKKDDTNESYSLAPRNKTYRKHKVRSTDSNQPFFDGPCIVTPKTWTHNHSIRDDLTKKSKLQ